MKNKFLTFFIILFLATIVISKTIHISSDYIEPSEKTIIYQGNILLKIPEDKLLLTSNNMVINKINNKWIDLNVDGKVHIEFENGVMEGIEMKYNIESQKGTIKNASVTINDSQSSETIFISCETLEFDLKNNTFSGKSEKEKVSITKGSIIAKAFEFWYDRNEGKIILSNNVDLKDEKKKLKLLGESVSINTKDNSMKGKNVKVEIVVE
ncbi:MAG: hypothetical protein PWQ83_561 [Thermosipho sp. (in: thermotogales)]|jgi:lipopolysaccharide assembly outer membrane protein LptD (OstA)|nr:hypothetical protein [Thermosipho sp. (in: thermotogales)]